MAQVAVSLHSRTQGMHSRTAAEANVHYLLEGHQTPMDDGGDVGEAKDSRTRWMMQ